jgi:hypothetical protein
MEALNLGPEAVDLPGVQHGDGLFEALQALFDVVYLGK